MPDPANPIVLDMAFERLRFETGFDVRAVIAERDRYREALRFLANIVDPNDRKLLMDATVAGIAQEALAA